MLMPVREARQRQIDEADAAIVALGHSKSDPVSLDTSLAYNSAG